MSHDKEKPMPTTRNDVHDNAKKVSVAVLQACLTDGIDLYNATRQAHWNVKGPQFHALHTLFETFYTTLATDIDALAERLVQLGGTAMGTSQSVTSGSRLAPYPTDLRQGEAHLAAMIERYGALAASIRAGIDSTDEAGDADTADILTGVSKNLDKALWMLEATAEK
jgi:starvation-inducible DNA-binding protein